MLAKVPIEKGPIDRSSPITSIFDPRWRPYRPVDGIEFPLTLIQSLVRHSISAPDCAPLSGVLRIHGMSDGVPLAFTIEQLRDLYRMLPPDQRAAFLRLIGAESTAESVREFLKGMSIIEHDRFSAAIKHQTGMVIFPILLQKAVEVAKELGHLNPQEMQAEVLKRFAAATSQMLGHASELEAEKLKAKRDRKSDPETIERNVQICDLKRSDKRQWPNKRLADRFHVTERYVSKVLSEETKWRRLAAEIGTK